MTATLVWPRQFGWEAGHMGSAPEAGAPAWGADPDAPLVTRCARGEEEAWEALVKLHHRRVYGLCYRFTSNSEEAQDLTQEVFLRVYRNLGNFHAGAGTFRVWLTSLTRNLLIDHYRRTRKEKLVDSIEERLPTLETLATPEVHPEARTAGREAGELLRAALARISPELREAVILRDLEEMEYREIAAVLRVPDGTVKSRISRGRAELARVLRKLGATL